MSGGLFGRGVLDAGDDEIARFQHGSGGLGETGLIAIDGWDGAEPRQIHCETNYDERDARHKPLLAPATRLRGCNGGAAAAAGSREHYAKMLGSAGDFCQRGRTWGWTITAC